VEVIVAKKICIVGLEDYAMLTGNPSYVFFGGESVQHVLLARAWRDLGHDVSVIVHDHGQPFITNVDGIRAIATYAPEAGLPGIRFIHPRLTRVVNAMRAADADIYYQSPASPWSGVAAWYAKSFGRQSVLRIASDSNCRRDRQAMRSWRDRRLYEYGLKTASLVAAQTEHQRELLLGNYGLESEVVSMTVDTPTCASSRQKDVDVLWVGNLRPVKRPDLALELARRLPQYRFVLVGGSPPGTEDYFASIEREARSLPNVVLAGGVAYPAVGEWFDRARLHVNTSDYEGFPNTFLQAWVRGVPVVSFFDPDGLIERRALGTRCADVAMMCNEIDALLRDPAACAAKGERARQFVRGRYSAKEIALRYLELLDRRGALPERSREDPSPRMNTAPDQ
jgi:glycosyltransferase involved in cell wall biosynthesis